MQCLPLVAGSSRWALFMADGSAAALTEALLADDPHRSAPSLAEALRQDPPLLLWTVCTADRLGGFRPESVEDTARWLAAHALQAFQWKRSENQWAEPLGVSEAEWNADRVAAAVLLAELAARLAAGQKDLCSQQAFLLGLLHEPQQWLAIASPDGAGVLPVPAEMPNALLPGWLKESADTPAAAAVQQAAAILRGDPSAPDAAELAMDACRRRAAEAHLRWLAPAAGLGPWLPALAAKLARLAVLEDKFQETLEIEKLEAMAEFAAGAGHEINNPLTVIAGRAQLFLREEQDPERRRGLALINAQAKRIYEMIADMMLFARPPRPEPQTCDLAQLVDRLIEEFVPEAGRQETAVCRTGAGGPLPIEVDPTQLTVAIRALCQNAMEAIGRDGRIEVCIEPVPREVRIRVSDNGPGIPPEERRHLFDPYYSARQAGRGLGLGLSKCWRIVTNHGGRIEVESEPGHGATFIITLPRHA